MSRREKSYQNIDPKLKRSTIKGRLKMISNRMGKLGEKRLRELGIK
jgi:hypothetical protein